MAQELIDNKVSDKRKATNLYLPGNLWRKVRLIALTEGKTATAAIEEALRLWLRKRGITV